MADESPPRGVADALTEVSRRRGEEEARHRAELAEVDQEVESLRTAMANLQQQLEALGKFREELVARLDSVSTGASQRTYEAIFQALREQAQALSGRAAVVADLMRSRRHALDETLEDEEIKGLLTEYQQFKEHVEPHIASFPETYRAVLQGKHHEVQERLREALGDESAELPEVEGPALSADVVVAVDAPEGVAEVVMLVLPVIEHVQTAWAEREEDLQTWLAARAMQAIYQVCHAFGLPGAQAMYGGHQGLLAVEVELGAGEPAAVRAALSETLDRTFAQAPELRAAKVEVHAQPVNVDHLFPPEEESEAPEVADQEEVSHAG